MDHIRERQRRGSGEVLAARSHVRTVVTVAAEQTRRQSPTGIRDTAARDGGEHLIISTDTTRAELFSPVSLLKAIDGLDRLPAVQFQITTDSPRKRSWTGIPYITDQSFAGTSNINSSALIHRSASENSSATRSSLPQSILRRHKHKKEDISKIRNKRRALEAPRTSYATGETQPQQERQRNPGQRGLECLMLRDTDAGKSSSLHATHAQSSAETSGFGSFGDVLEGPSAGSLEDLSLAPSAASQLGFPAPCYRPVDKAVDLENSKREAAKKKTTRVAAEFIEMRDLDAGGQINESQYNGNIFKGTNQEGEGNKFPSTMNFINKNSNSSPRDDDTMLDDEEYDVFLAQQGAPRSSTSSRRSSVRSKINTKSAWMAWSEARRASFKRRQQLIEERLAQEERSRTPTPVRKARKESIKFINISPELEEKYMSDDADLQMEAAHGRLGTPRAGRGGGAATVSRIRQKHDWTEVKMSMFDWNRLLSFWEQRCFVISRYTGIFCGIIAIVLGVVSLASSHWSSYSAKAHAGLFVNCTWIEDGHGHDDCEPSTAHPLRDFQSGVFQVCETNTSRGLDLAFTECTERDVYHRPYWQNAVIGLLIFSLGFGVLATVLSMCGVCSTALAKKIYYFHSAGEIFLICALAAVAALVTFPVGTELVLKLPDHSFGFGFGLGWGAAVFYLGASICMSVDDMVRQFSEKLPSWCPNCCKQCVPPPSSQLSTV
ncbi:uncharacterized protein LOC106174080 [Lingula anatina]|uniref:Uncharacterized protein LOC106174080 n=1 Tax=Lingula anatina TaxID=7574 RepID=A0A1S3JLA9_LINAN|nr:uncharacterized protein LOC106174080 [Lingula anatina]|eukprot:XP_013410926.1 uncharacterized protein LOC106174080 [Lingula anatina]